MTFSPKTIMSSIQVVKHPKPENLQSLGVHHWPIWEKEASTFPWFYDEQEVCFFLEGEVTVTPEGGSPVSFGAGDLVTFPQGMRCIWHIQKNVRKHYKFG